MRPPHAQGADRPRQGGGEAQQEEGRLAADSREASEGIQKIFSIANFTKYFQAMEVADYATKVPEEVRTANTEKLETSRLEIERLCEAVTTLAKI